MTMQKVQLSSKLHAVFGGGHVVDGDGVHGGLFGLVENELVLPTLLDSVVLWGEEYVWCELSDAGQKGNNDIVLLLFLHGFHDSVKFFHDGWVVAVLPIFFISNFFTKEKIIVDHGVRYFG